MYGTRGVRSGYELLISKPEVAKVMGHEHWGNDVPGWINAWIDDEGQRPWPSGNIYHFIVRKTLHIES